jgi:hypothetical protein
LCYYTSQVACPFFDPLEARTPTGAQSTATLPLGDAWSGFCCAQPGVPVTPDPAVERQFCNLGYARHSCSRFPASAAAADANRFTVRRDDGDTIEIYAVVERDHHPAARGPLNWSRRAGAFSPAPLDGPFLHQARAYISAYLRRKSEAPTP